MGCNFDLAYVFRGDHELSVTVSVMNSRKYNILIQTSDHVSWTESFVTRERRVNNQGLEDGMGWKYWLMFDLQRRQHVFPSLQLFIVRENNCYVK